LANPIEDSLRSTTTRAVFAIVALTILAPALGGSTQLWAQGALAIGAGLLMLVLPRRRSLGLIPNLLFSALFLIALTGFLPARWFTPLDWRIDMLKLEAQLPPTRSLQPWLTLQWSCFLLLALAWAYYLASFRWSRRMRETACITFAIAVLVLSAALTVAYITKLRVPFWPAVKEFGFFPNRNQTSNVLGLGGVMIYALGLQRFQEDRKYWWLWFASLSLLCWALIIDGSRAGIILFFCGALAVHIFWWTVTKERRRPLFAFGGLALLIALFLVDGGATLVRFGKETAGFFSPSQNFRLSIYRDAINLIGKSPMLGFGLGNFWPLFALNRNYSASISQVAHPESDWLWSAVDLGSIGLLLGLVLFFWWLKQCPPFDAGTNRLLRVAAMICGIAFAVHGVFDVSGHRPGALWPAIFFASIAIHPGNEYRRSKVAATIFRITGVLLIAIGSWWIASVCGAKALPTTATVERLRSQMDAAIAREDYSRLMRVASEALTIAPLDWELYFKRGVAEAGSFRADSEVQRDFAIARYLLPNWPDLYLKQGIVWLDLDEPDRAFGVWEEGMQHFPEMAPALYADIFGSVKSDTALRDRWRKLGESDKRCLLVFLRSADNTEFQIELQELLADDRELRAYTPDELKTLLAVWYEKGDKLWLAQTLQEHPDWKKIAWRQLARVYADYQDYRQAFETADQFLPQIDKDNAEPSSSAESPVELALRFRSNPTDPSVGEALARALAKEGNIDDALLTLRVVRDLPDSPKYVRALEARLWAKKQAWKRAWNVIAPLVSAQE
jgi:O-antigen ligase